MFEIGDSLKEARLRRSLDLVDVEHDTKIRSKYIAALEQEDFQVLPGPAYAKGFLRTYATYLGLDGQVFVDEYNARHIAEDDSEYVQARPLPSAPTSRRTPSLRLVGGLSLIAIVIFTGAHLAAGDDRVASAPDTNVTTVAASESDASETSTTDTPETTQETVVPTRAHLVVSATGGSSWLQVRRGTASGPVMYSATLSDGATKSFDGAKLYVTVGYPSAVRLSSGSRKLNPTSSQTTTYLVTPAAIKAV